MRKYNRRNKVDINIIVAICILVLVAFSLFIKRVSELEKKSYEIDANSVLFDEDKNPWTLSSTGIIKSKWNGNYYLSYDDKDIRLNKQVVVFNNASKTLNLYGTIYKINQDESVEMLKDETKIDDTLNPIFYKLADRKYLLVAGVITSDVGSFETNNYLIVELDKVGNALLTNNTLNVKTFKETTLVTKTYTFDIANEILSFGDVKIDAKKIIGSTNMYKPQEEKTKKGNTVPTTANQGGSGGGGQETPTTTSTTTTTTTTKAPNGENGGNGNGSGGGSGEGEGNKTVVKDNRVYQDKNFSIVSTTMGTTYLTLDYSVYDPKNEYKNIFVEIENDETKSVETYFLAKNATSLHINKLLPNVKYNLTFKYSYLDDKYNTKYDSFNIAYSIKTVLPDTSINVTKIIDNKVYYTIETTDKIMYGAKVELYINNETTKRDEYAFNSESAQSSYSGYFDISKYENVDYLNFKVPVITYQTGDVDTNVTLRVKN